MSLVLPNAEDILLGAIPLEAMDLTINPRRELVGVHGDQILHSMNLPAASRGVSLSVALF